MYLVRKKNAKTAHAWTGFDTVCRMYSTGGLRKKAYQVVAETVLPTCSMCENKKPVLPGESIKVKLKSTRPNWKRKGVANFSDSAVAKAVKEASHE